MYEKMLQKEWLSLSEILAKVILIEIYNSLIQQNSTARFTLLHTKEYCVRIGNDLYRTGLKLYRIELE